MPNIKLILAYEGTAYLGWQKNREGSSVQEVLQNILEQILQHPIALQAASRTDAGVHAYGQAVNFFTDKLLKLDRLCISLNSLLPSDIVVRGAEWMADNFHPTLDCQLKEYHYWICSAFYQLPQHRRYSWHIHHPLDLDAMRQTALELRGVRDYSSFTNFKKNEKYASHVRQVETIEIVNHPEERIQFILKGNHFLYKMVRNLVGTMVQIGKGMRKAEDIPAILEARDRTGAGMTAPAHGLTLYRVLY